MSGIPNCSDKFQIKSQCLAAFTLFIDIKKAINTIEVSSQALSLSLVNPGLIKTKFFVTIAIYYQASR